MKHARLLGELVQRGVRLWAEGDEICYQAPRGALSAELRRQLTKGDRPRKLIWDKRIEADSCDNYLDIHRLRSPADVEPAGCPGRPGWARPEHR
ncbi:MAG: hypothetical protein GY856_55215, partial [bacterium]|nr:hypothetical protein [bacterium]